jgi:hypothetical protein
MISKSKFDPLSPVSLATIFVVAGVIVPFYPFMLEIDGFSLLWPYDYLDKLGSAVAALVAYLLALALFTFAFVLSRGLRVSSGQRPHILSTRAAAWPPLVLAIIAVALAGIAAAAAALGGFDSLVAAAGDRTRAFAGLNYLLLPQNALIAVGIAWALAWTRRRPVSVASSLPLAAFCAATVLLISVQGSKATIFVFLVALAVVYHYRVRRLGLLQMLLLGLALFVVLIAYHLFKQEYLLVGEIVSLDNADSLAIGGLTLLGLQWTGNMMQLQGLATLIDGMPQTLDFQNGATLLMVVLILVPSALFPAKPLTAPGIYTEAFWPDKWFNEGTTMPPGFIGEMFMNFGWPGILIGAALAGYWYGISMKRMQVRPNCDLTLGKHAVMVAVMLHFFRGELAAVLLLFATVYLPLWIICHLCSVRGATDRGAPRDGRAIALFARMQ